MGWPNVIGLFGGLAIFLYGIGLARESLQLVAGARLRQIIATFTENRLLGVFSGTAVTVFLQSSTATTVMLVSFVSTGLMSLGQAMSVTLGAGVGTSVTVQIVSFKVDHLALLAVALGFAIRFFSKRRRARYVGQLILAFGFIFFGMHLMGQATLPLKEAGFFQALITYLGNNPLVAVLVGAVFTTVVQASVATIGLLISLSLSGSMTLAVAVPVMIGANVGTGLSSILIGVGASAEGKRVVMANLAYKVVAAVAVLLLLHPFMDLTRWTSDDLAHQIANAHTLFNIFAALLFLPFTNLAARTLERLYHPVAPGQSFGPRYLDRRALDTPALAFAHATREFLRAADIAQEMLVDTIRVFESSDVDLLADIESRDDQIDILNNQIKLYLARLTQRDLGPDQAEQELELITLSNYVENAGDVITKNILPLAQKMISGGLSFSEDGWKEIRDLHGKVCENFDLAIAAYSARDETIARKVQRHRANFERIEAELRQAHLARLHKAVPATFETSAIHMDLITYLDRVNQHVCRLAASALKDVERRQNMSDD